MENLSNNEIILNDAVYKAVLRGYEKETSGRAGQPQIIVGAHGSGKTFLMQRLFDTVSSRSGFMPVWIDGRTVFSSKDILHVSANGRCVLFVDDFHYYLQRTPNEDQYAFRGALSEKDGPILVASAPVVSPQLMNYGAALFEGFHIHYIKPLSDEELKGIVGGTDKKNQRAQALMEYMPRTARAALMVKDIIRDSRTSEDDLSLLIKRISPLYQKLFDELLPQQQRIMCALAGESGGLKLSGIREKTGQEAGKISPYLTQMLASGLVLKDSQSTRGGSYRIADPLFNLWLPKYTM